MSYGRPKRCAIFLLRNSFQAFTTRKLRMVSSLKRLQNLIAFGEINDDKMVERNWICDDLIGKCICCLIKVKETDLMPITPGGTQHMNIRGGKSDIFGSEYCQK